MTDLRVAIVHYHLKPGGVTRVIEHTISALEDSNVRLAVLTGEPYEGQYPLNTATIPNLFYNTKKGDPTALSTALRQQARQLLGKPPDIWHIHNPFIGKNTVFPEMISNLAQNGEALLLQIHDFAEEGRPENFRALKHHLSHPALLYPQAAHLHYAVLNSRDFTFLKRAGFKHLHYLPNPIATKNIPEKRDQKESKRLYLYPTRSIRRKNMGEFLLLSALAEKDTLFATTLAPNNPTALPIYEEWKRFAKALQLPVQFAISEEKRSISFGEWIAKAHRIVTTSIIEGFGLAFLEPWLWGKILIGRNLPEITTDFVKTGINLEHLYHRTEVPLELLPPNQLEKELKKGLMSYYKAYGKTLPPEAFSLAYTSIVRGDWMDFGRLNEGMQQILIRKIAHSSELCHSLKQQLLHDPRESVLAHNRTQITHSFSLPSYKKRLLAIYEHLANSPQSPLEEMSDPDAVLTQFMNPSRFHLLCS